MYHPKTKILDFDIEFRPMSYMGGDFTTGEVTAIAWSWANQRKVEVEYMTAADMFTQDAWVDAYQLMLGAFVDAYNQADIVTGHYIRMFDLPKINAACFEVGMRPLAPKMVSDTKVDLVKLSGISKSQENLGATLSYFDGNQYLANKEHMSQVDWRWANRLTAEGVAETVRRVKGDVKQHKALRLALLDANVLKGPKVWRP
jgi:hypothetical protein